MKRSNHVATLCIAALGAVFAALPASAATELVNLRAEVQGRGRATQLYGIKPSEAVPLAIGETVRVSLVGTALGGAQVPVNAAFSQITSRTSLALGRSGPNWVDVKGTANYANGIAQIAYKVTDRRYTMRGGFTEGRITFQMSGDGRAATPGNTNDSRLQAARDVARALYRTLLGDDLQSQRAEDDVNRIASRGYAGVQQVAAEVARAADARRIFAGQNDVRVAGELYRGLLGRTSTDSELMNQDGGFRGAVEKLRREGLEAEVRNIVGSEEFQNVHNLRQSGLT